MLEEEKPDSDYEESASLIDISSAKTSSITKNTNNDDEEASTTCTWIRLVLYICIVCAVILLLPVHKDENNHNTKNFIDFHVHKTNYIQPKSNTSVKQVQPVRFLLKKADAAAMRWAVDGTVVRQNVALDAEGMAELSDDGPELGEILGAPFLCPAQIRLYNRQRCVQVFLRNRKQVVMDHLVSFAFVKASDQIAKKRELADVIRNSKRADVFLIHALWNTYGERPVVSSLDENSVTAKGQVVNIARTGRDIHRDVCAVANALEQLYNVPRASGDDNLVVVYGSQKGDMYYTLFLLGIMANYNVMMLVSYMNMKQALMKVIGDRYGDNHSKNRLKHLVLFVPFVFSDDACDTVRALIPMHIENIVLINTNGLHTFFCKGERDTMNNVRSTAYLQMTVKYSHSVHNHNIIDQCSSYPMNEAFLDNGDLKSTNSMTQTKHGVYLIVRSNPKSQAETVFYDNAVTYNLFAKEWSDALYDEKRAATIAVPDMYVLPLSSGDNVVDLLGSLTRGHMFVQTVLNYAQYDAFSNFMQISVLSGSPVQMPMLMEEYLAKQFVLPNDVPVLYSTLVDIKSDMKVNDEKKGSSSTANVGMVDSVRLQQCATGGGAPNPYFMQFLVKTKACAMVWEGWGSYENWMIAFGYNGVYSFMQDSVIGWKLRSFGPYDAKDGKGELLLKTKAMNIHPEKAYNNERYEEIDGVMYFHTRDIVKIVTGKEGSFNKTSVQMIDKTTCPFQLSNGMWVPTGVIERTIEGNMQVILNAVVFGSVKTLGLVIVVWPSDACRDWTELQLLTHIQLLVTQRPLEIIKADEPWEYRPRAKVRKLLHMKFGKRANDRMPGAVLNDAGAENVSIERIRKMSVFAKQVLSYALTNTTDACDTGGRLVCDVLLSCHEGACLVRDKNNLVREPQVRMMPYDPNQEWSVRINRFDNIPWTIWDMQEKMPFSDTQIQQFLHDILTLKDAKNNWILETLPLVIPSLGQLHALGIRFRLRLHCAHAIATRSPHLLKKSNINDVYTDVMHVCRPEYYALQKVAQKGLE